MPIQLKPIFEASMPSPFPAISVRMAYGYKNLRDLALSHIKSSVFPKAFPEFLGHPFCTPPKFNSSPLKNDGLEDDPFLLGPGIFLEVMLNFPGVLHLQLNSPFCLGIGCIY